MIAKRWQNGYDVFILHNTMSDVGSAQSFYNVAQCVRRCTKSFLIDVTDFCKKLRLFHKLLQSFRTCP